MSHGHTKINSKGICIYCFKENVPLTDEHIVPFSLGGQHVIYNASCDECSNITKKFEQDVGRGLWGDARISYNAPSRRRRNRETHIVLANPKDPKKQIQIPYSEYPAPLVFYKMHQAGLLQGLPENYDISNQWELVAVCDQKRIDEFEKKYPGLLTAKFKHVPDSFARLIAKIGYGQTLTALDPGDFHPVCIPYILGDRKNLSYVVGGRFNIAEPIEGIGYKLDNYCVGNYERLLIISEVRLFADNHTPTYHVVVGDVTGHSKIQTVLKKFNTEPVDTFLIENFKNRVMDEAHMVPQVWPPPFV